MSCPLETVLLYALNICYKPLASNIYLLVNTLINIIVNFIQTSLLYLFDGTLYKFYIV